MNFAEKSSAVFSRDLFVRVWNTGFGVIVARILDPGLVGVWYILLMIPGYSEAFGRLKFDIASVYFLSKGKYKLGEVYFNLIITSLFSSVVVVVIFFWQRDFILVRLFKNSLETYSLIYLMFAYIPLCLMNMNYKYLFLAKEDVKGYNAMILISPIVTSLLGIFLLLVFEIGVLALVISTLAGGIAGILYGLFRILQTDKIICHLNIKMIREFFKFSWKLYISGLVGHFQLYVSGILVAIYLLPSSVTFFRMGQQKALILSMVAAALGAFLYPLVAKDSDGRAGEVTAKACRICFLVISLLAIVGALLIKPAVSILYGVDYLPQVLPFLIMLPGVIFYSSASILTSYFMGKGRTEIILKLSLIPLLLQVILCKLLIPVYGILGAAFAAAFSYFLIGMVNIFVFVYISKICFSDVLIPKKTDVVLLIDFVKKSFSKRCARFLCN